MNKSVFFKIITLGTAALMLTSCASMGEFVNYTDEEGNLNVDKIVSVGTAVVNTAVNVADAAEGLPPQSQYELGRSAAANVLQQYSLYENKYATDYVNKICGALTVNSPMPYLYKGYFVAIFDSDEINAISTPGGHILISKGLVESCNSEDALASVIAHELAHIQIGHSKKAIEGERNLDAITSGLSVVFAAGGKDFTVEDVNNLNNTSDSFTRRVVRSGYSNSQEFEADEYAMQLMTMAGYNPYALVYMLEAIKGHSEATLLGWGKTHPSPEKRINAAEKILAKENYPQIDMSPRAARFAQFKRKLY